MKPLLMSTLFSLGLALTPVLAGTMYVNRSTQTFVLKDDFGKTVYQGRVSTGKKGYTTPAGEFTVKSKNRRGYSRKYRAPMPYTVAFNGNYAIHQGRLPSGPVKASHGCIRVDKLAARVIFKVLNINDRIFIQ